jgi:hypothetical protein
LSLTSRTPLSHPTASLRFNQINEFVTTAGPAGIGLLSQSSEIVSTLRKSEVIGPIGNDAFGCGTVDQGIGRNAEISSGT